MKQAFENLATPPEIRPVPGHKGYFVSSDGRVYSAVMFGGVMRELRAVKGGNDRAYRYIQLGKRYRTGVHQLVALTFLEKPIVEPGRRLVVRHKDNNPANNHLENLEWGTQSDNLLDRHRHGTATIGVLNPASKLTANDVAEIRRLRGQGMKYRDIGERFGMRGQSVWRIATGAQWKHVAEANAPRVRRSRKVNSNASAFETSR